MKHINVSVFVLHAGCPHQCSFCNQRSISGAKSQPTAQDVRDAALVAMRSSPEGIKDGEIAFFGGSFTAIDRDYMIELLSSAQEFIGENGFTSVQHWTTEVKTRDRDDKPEYKCKIDVAAAFSNQTRLTEYYHNSSWLEFGGSPEKAVTSAFVSQIDAYLKQNGKYSKSDSKIKFQDVADCLILVSSSFSTETSYLNQT